jgi:hypothetical protein
MDSDNQARSGCRTHTHGDRPGTTPSASLTDPPRAQSNTVQDPWVPNVLGGPREDGIDRRSDSRHVNSRKPTHSHRLTLSHTGVCHPAQPGRGHRSPGKLMGLLAAAASTRPAWEE